MKTIILALLLISPLAHATDTALADDLLKVIEWTPSSDGREWWGAMMKLDGQEWRHLEKWIKVDAEDAKAKDLAPLAATACAEVAQLFESEARTADPRGFDPIPSASIARIKDAIQKAQNRARAVLQSVVK